MPFLTPNIDRLKEKGRVEDLVAALGHGDRVIGEKAANALVELAGRRAIELCIDVFRAPGPGRRGSSRSAQALDLAAEVLFRIADPSGALTRSVRDDAELRHRLLRTGKRDALSVGKRAPAYLVLEAALRDAEPTARRELAALLVDDALQLEVMTGGGYGVGDWGFLVSSVDEMGDEIEARRAAEEARREGLRREALNAALPWSNQQLEILQEVPAEAAKILVASYEADPSSIDRATLEIQRKLFYAAGESGDPEGEKAGLKGLKLLRRGSSPHMSAWLSEDMTTISDKRSGAVSDLIASHDVEGLVAELEWLHGPVLDRAVRQLGTWRAQRAARPLVTVLRETVRYEDRKTPDIASRALESLGRSAAPALVEALKDELTLVRWFAARILGKVGDASVVPALIGAVDDPDEGVREAAAVAVEQIEARERK